MCAWLAVDEAVHTLPVRKVLGVLGANEAGFSAREIIRVAKVRPPFPPCPSSLRKSVSIRDRVPPCVPATFEWHHLRVIFARERVRLCVRRQVSEGPRQRLEKRTVIIGKEAEKLCKKVEALEGAPHFFPRTGEKRWQPPTPPREAWTKQAKQGKEKSIPFKIPKKNLAAPRVVGVPLPRPVSDEL